MKRVGVWVDGLVQGVGFRWWGEAEARRRGLTGTIQNLWDGRVEAHVQGPDDDVDAFVRVLTGRTPARGFRGRVDSFEVGDEPLRPGEATFEIR